MVRQFPENGMKLLLEDARNVRDLLALSQNDLVHLVDFDCVSQVRTTFVARDYRHVEADVVLTAPLRSGARPQGHERLWVYLLIEHQSTPDPFMILRLLDYVVQIYKVQVRRARRPTGERPFAPLQPVLPIVFYTGLERWDALDSMANLIAMGDRFRSITPTLDPLFLNLRDVPGERIASAGGHFGSVLRIVRERRRRPNEFRAVLQEAIQALEAMSPGERERWLELLSYVLALVYHERKAREHQSLQELIEASVQTDRERREITHVGQTIAQMFEARGRKKGRMEQQIRTLHDVLVRLLKVRFGDVPAKTLAAIRHVEDVDQLNAWLDRIPTARSLGDVGIAAGRRE
jgi:hypothetical protein